MLVHKCFQDNDLDGLPYARECYTPRTALQRNGRGPQNPRVFIEWLIRMHPNEPFDPRLITYCGITTCDFPGARMAHENGVTRGLRHLPNWHFSAKPVYTPDPPPHDPRNRHEEGGWIYTDVTNEEIVIRRAPRGLQAEINLDSPPEVPGGVVVGIFHTHPNPSAEGWYAGPSEADRIADARDGVPDLIHADDGVHFSGPENGCVAKRYEQ